MLTLAADALWHVEEGAAAAEATLGRVELLKLKACALSPAGDELVLAGEGRCHLLAPAPESGVSLLQWRDAVRARLGAPPDGPPGPSGVLGTEDEEARARQATAAVPPAPATAPAREAMPGAQEAGHAH